MKALRAAALVAGLTCCITLQAALLPIAHLDEKTVQAYNAYVEKFEREYIKPFTDSGKFWADAKGGPGKPTVESRMNDDVESGSIHHFSGTMHLEGGTIEDIRHLMEDYPNYPKNFKPDVTQARGDLQPDTTKGDDHYIGHLTLSESTLWMNVQYETAYDTHYKLLDDHRWMSKSVAVALKEQKDAKDPSKGFYPEGEDHGFLWRTTTYWLVRQAGNGIDLQVDSLTLSRPNVTGFGWFGSKRSKEAVEKMLHDARTYIAAAHGK